MLIDKLNYLVDKKKLPDIGTLKALQLPFQSFEKWASKTAFCSMFRLNTSKIDPTTGFVNLFDTRYTNVEAAKVFNLSLRRFGITQPGIIMNLKWITTPSLVLKVEDTRRGG